MLTQFRQSIRTLLKYRLYTSFAFIGLSVSIASAWFITEYVKAAYSYDTFHTNHENIYRLSMEITAGGNTEHYATTGKPLGEYLEKDYPAVEAYARLVFIPAIVKKNNESFKENDFFLTNPQTFSVFTFDFISGNGNTFSQPNSILLSQSQALKYFNSVDIIGKQLVVNDAIYYVRGVFSDWPPNTHIRINALLSIEEATEYDVQSWFDIEQYTYVLVNPNMPFQELNDNLDQLAQNTLGPLIEGSGVGVQFRAESLKEVYHSPALIDDVRKGSLDYTNALALAGIFILLIACLNLINLNLTMSTQRSKEIVVKKILGISRKQLLQQSSMEVFCLTILVILLSFAMVKLCTYCFPNLLSFASLSIYENWLFTLFMLAIIFISGLLGSTYSRVYLSFSNQLIPKELPSVNLFKKVMLGFQYCIAAIVLILTLSMERQLAFINNKDLGFDKEEVLIVSLPENEDTKNKALLIREHLSSLTSVENASLIGGGALPGEENGKDLFEVKVDGVRTEKIYNIYRVDEQYFDLLDIQIIKGRNFDPNKISDLNEGVIINEAFANTLKWDNPIGKEIWYGEDQKKVIGVIKNFHNKSLHNIIEPIIFLYDINYANNLLIKAKPTEFEPIKSAWSGFFPGSPFSLSYFDQFIGKMYEEEHQLSQLFRFFSMISLLLCAMGLFALFSLHVQQRMKEMSIRKVLGADYRNLFYAIVKKYGIVFFLSLLIAIPIGWMLVRSWLSGFSFAAQIGFDVYFASGLIIMVTSLTVISYHLFKIIHVNPVSTLKNE